MVKVGIVGATGYTGAELLRLLSQHPNVEVVAITSRAEAGVDVTSIYPNLRGHYDLQFIEPDVDVLGACDVIFFATPHGVAHNMVPELAKTKALLIDLSADFRLRDPELWASWYGQPHGCPEILDQVVYGLPEVNRESIRKARIIACPGCYPTASQLALIPLLERDLIDPQSIIINAASGTSGAGRQANIGTLLSEASDSFKAYASAGHRHLPEIEQGLRDVQAPGSKSAQATFVPHLLPMVRGIHATVYAKLQAEADLQRLFEERYQNEPFVDVLPAGSHPETRSVKGANVCRLAVVRPQGRDTVVVMSVIDNLTKGASGQAVQIMNIALGFNEAAGLQHPGLTP